MKPFDPRLAKEIRSIKGNITFTVLLASLSAISLVFQAIFTAQAISLAFLSNKSIFEIMPYVVISATAWILRTIFTSVNDFISRRYGIRAVADLRQKAVDQVLKIRKLPMPSGGALTLITRGIEGMEIYVARYLPQLVISAVVPIGIGAVILWLDPLAALILVITIPLIPLFMALVGWFTASNVEKYWKQATNLSSTMVDLLNGLPELTIFNRAKQQATAIERLGKLQQTATMKVLKISFLSALVLEILATISVAIIAVAIGLRLVNGEMQFWTGLAVLILAPEVYAPLRMLGMHFHAAAEGMEAWNQVKIILDAPAVERGNETKALSQITWPVQEINHGNLRLKIPAGKVEAGKLTVVVGPSGVGKSSLLRMICGEVSGECSSNVLSQESFAKNVALVDQFAKLSEGTVRQVLNYGRTKEATDEELISIMNDLGLSLSLEQFVSDRSIGVSIGQRRRLAIAHAALREPRFLLLDEPSAALDEHSENLILEHINKFVRNGGAVLTVAHRKKFSEEADHLIDFSGAL